MVRLKALVALAVGLAPALARANPAGDVPAGIDESGNRINAIATVDYTFEQDTSNIWREHVGDPTATPGSPVPTERDLSFKSDRHTITPKLELGLYHDVWIYGALPVIASQTRELTFDQGVTAANSSTIQDGFLTAPASGNDVFSGPTRHGIDQVNLGLGFAPMNQRRDDTKPTWKLGAELRLAVGSVMKFDPNNPNANTAVGYGVHEVRVWTSFDRRLGWAEPYIELYWQAPVGVTKDSLFQNPGFGATNTGKGQVGGVQGGIEITAYDDPVEHNHVGFELGGKAIAHFEGRDYSEMWEVFANNPQLQLDADPVTPGVQPLAYPGISNIENYLETRATAALRASLGAHVHVAATFELMWETDHAITFADAGVVLPTCSATVTESCTTYTNGLVNQGTAEVNPLHEDKIDLVGHRYLSEDNFGFAIGLRGEVLF